MSAQPHSAIQSQPECATSVNSSKRKRPTSPPGLGGTEFHKKFEFIVGNDNNARKNARVHVMREFMRRKRFEETGRSDNEPAPIQKKGRQRKAENPASSKLTIPILLHEPAPPIPSSSFGQSLVVSSQGQAQSLPAQPPFSVEGECSQLPANLSSHSSLPSRYSIPTTPKDGHELEASHYQFRPAWTLPSFPSRGFNHPVLESLATWAAVSPWTKYTDVETFEQWGGKEYAKQQSTHHADDETADAAAMHYPSPQAVVGNIRKDPFDCYPIPVSQSEHELIDHLIRVMPTSFHSSAPRPDHHFQYFRDMVFRPAIDNALSFQTMVLSFAASHRARMTGKPEDVELAAMHKSRVVFVLNGRLKAFPDDCSDNLIMTLLGFAACEDLSHAPGSKEKSWVHLRAVMHLVRNRGGPAAFANTPRMVLHINYLDYRMAGYQNVGSTFSWIHFPIPPGLSPDSPLIARQELLAYTREFLVELKLLYSFALSSNTSTCKAQQPRRHAIFKPGTSIYRLLSSPPGMRPGVPGYRVQLVGRLVALFYINVALLDMRAFHEDSEQFLKLLSLKVVAYDLDNSTSPIEILVHLLILGLDDGDQSLPLPQTNLTINGRNAQRPWKVGAMIKVAKRLGRSSWQQLTTLLLRMLAQADFGAGFQGMDGGIEDWSQELKREIEAADDMALIAPALA